MGILAGLCWHVCVRTDCPAQRLDSQVENRIFAAMGDFRDSLSAVVAVVAVVYAVIETAVIFLLFPKLVTGVCIVHADVCGLFFDPKIKFVEDKEEDNEI